MSAHSPRRILHRVLIASASAALLAGCGGGGGGGGGGSGQGGAAGTFRLTEVTYGRLVVQNDKPTIVSPLTTVETDPITGAVIPDSLEALAPGVDIDARVGLGLSSSYVPRVVPRNGVFALRFSRPVEPSSVTGDTVDASGTVLKAGSVRLRLEDGTGIAVDLRVRGSEVWIDPVHDGNVGLPPSPVQIDSDGSPRASATGFVLLSLDFAGGNSIRATDGSILSERPDQLGTTVPIGINPGNRVLDFITQNELFDTSESFNGFLPDRSRPRIVREYKVDATLDFSAGDSATATSVTVASANHNQIAGGGLGEWAGGLLVVRPGKKNEETHQILQNSNVRITIVDSFDGIPRDGDVISLRRAEFFEPDPSNPIDAALFDPNNPQNLQNRLLANFIQAFEIDAQAEAVGSAIPLLQTLPAYCELRMRFNEPMDESSFLQWETFRVALNPDPGLGPIEKVARILLSQDRRTARIQPVREDPVSGTFEVVGWGPGVQSLQLILAVSPSLEFLQSRLTIAQLNAFQDSGFRGITDLGGQSLGFSSSDYDAQGPMIHYAESFATDESVSSQMTPPVSGDWGMLVHRFLGRPITGTDPDTGDAGVKFADQNNYYSPIADVNLQANGLLSGQPVVFSTKIHDDFFPPPDGQLGAFSQGAAAPLLSHITAADVAPFPHNGSRFQHIFRDVDASPGLSLAGTLLDLYRVSFAPIGGNVTTDVYEDISVHVAHSSIRPITRHNGNNALEPTYGLTREFDYESYYHDFINVTPSTRSNRICLFNGTFDPEAPNTYGDVVTCVPPGTRWTIQQSNLFAPPFDAHTYHPWPVFTSTFAYNNGDFPPEHRDQRDAFNTLANANGWNSPWKRKNNTSNQNVGGDSLVLEYRIRPQSTAVSALNGFTLALGILLAPEPFFRAYSLGDSTNPLNPDSTTDNRALCATNPTTMNPTANNFGDNARYFTVFDYVKITSKIRSPFVSVGTAPTFYPAYVQPPLAQVPPGTTVILEFAGASTVTGTGITVWDPDPAIANGLTNLAFRVVFVGNRTTLLTPSFETLAVPFLR